MCLRAVFQSYAEACDYFLRRIMVERCSFRKHLTLLILAGLHPRGHMFGVES
jgi:hypothetical protein